VCPGRGDGRRGVTTDDRVEQDLVPVGGAMQLDHARDGDEGRFEGAVQHAVELDEHRVARGLSGEPVEPGVGVDEGRDVTGARVLAAVVQGRTQRRHVRVGPPQGCDLGDQHLQLHGCRGISRSVIDDGTLRVNADSVL
jgi:hypothetical protein